MKTKFFLLWILLLLLTGCQLAREDMDTVRPQQDLIIGVLITTEHLEMPMGEDRIYAELQPSDAYSQEYVWPSIQGFPFYAATVPGTETTELYTTTGSDSSVSDVSIHMKTSDEEERIELSGTLYADTEHYVNTVFYQNPILQDAEGRVYVQTGTGMMNSSSVDAGAFCSETLESSATYTIDGVTTTKSTRVEIAFSSMYAPQSITLLQMDASHEILQQETYNPSEMPTSMQLLSDTAYLLVETQNSQDTTRQLVETDAESFDTFICREDGICVVHTISLE